MKLASQSIAVLVSAFGLFAVTQCAMPGNTLGIYHVDASVQTNTCGAGLGAPSPWKFNVELSLAATKLYWNSMDGSPLLVGEISGKAVSLDDTEGGSADSAPDGAPGPCTMERVETISLTLDSSSKPRSFNGTLTYAFSVVSGSDCSDQMSAQGGIYDTLPCTLTYGVAGSFNGSD